MKYYETNNISETIQSLQKKTSGVQVINKKPCEEKRLMSFKTGEQF